MPHLRFVIDEEALMSILQDYNEPKMIEEALSSPNKDEWRKTLEDEMESIKENHVWTLVNLPK